MLSVVRRQVDNPKLPASEPKTRCPRAPGNRSSSLDTGLDATAAPIAAELAWLCSERCFPSLGPLFLVLLSPSHHWADQAKGRGSAVWSRMLAPNC